MVVHIFLFRWKPETTDAEKLVAAERILALRESIPGIVEASFSVNASPRSQGFTHGGMMKFADREALEHYFVHPVHEELVGWLMPLIETAAELDYAL